MNEPSVTVASGWPILTGKVGSACPRPLSLTTVPSAPLARPVP
ncbi:hypothetical protein [Deinococcus koreensis]|nr:hypothetical protein [Deinococcus koreensis]